MKGVVCGVGLGALLYCTAAGGVPRTRRPSRRKRQLLAAAVVSAAVEELLWRGAVLQFLRPRLGTVPALATSSAAFATSHLPTARRRAFATHAGLATVLGAAALHRGGLALATAAHATYDALVLLEERSR